MASTAGALTGLPAKAPLRSTMCRCEKPWAANRRAWAAGSSLNTVASAISPRLRRTQRPSLRSMAGYRIIVGTGAGREAAAADRAGCGHHFAVFAGAQWAMFAFSQGRVVHVQAPEAIVAAPAGRRPLGRSRRRRHLDRALAAGAAQGAGGALRLRPAPALRDLGGEALRRQPRQGPGAVCRAVSGPRRPHRLRPAPAPSRAACPPSCSRGCSTALRCRLGRAKR